MFWCASTSKIVTFCCAISVKAPLKCLSEALHFGYLTNKPKCVTPRDHSFTPWLTCAAYRFMVGLVSVKMLCWAIYMLLHVHSVLLMGRMRCTWALWPSWSWKEQREGQWSSRRYCQAVPAVPDQSSDHVVCCCRWQLHERTSHNVASLL